MLCATGKDDRTKQCPNRETHIRPTDSAPDRRHLLRRMTASVQSFILSKNHQFTMLAGATAGGVPVFRCESARLCATARSVLGGRASVHLALKSLNRQCSSSWLASSLRRSTGGIGQRSTGRSARAASEIERARSRRSGSCKHRGRVEGGSRPRSGERSERSLDAPERSRIVSGRSDARLA